MKNYSIQEGCFNQYNINHLKSRVEEDGLVITDYGYLWTRDAIKDAYRYKSKRVDFKKYKYWATFNHDSNLYGFNSVKEFYQKFAK